MRSERRTNDLRWMAAAALAMSMWTAAIPAQSWLNSPISHTQPGEAANAGSGSPKVNFDGRYVAFNSEASNLVVGQVDASEVDVFLFDRQTNSMSLVSHAAGDPLRSSSPGFSQVKAISNSGGVLFDSTAPHLIAGETAGYIANTFLHYPATGNNLLISREAETSTRSNGECRGRALDQSNQFAVIACTGTNLQAGVTDTNAQHDLYLYRPGVGDNRLITHAAGSMSTAADVGVDAFNGQVIVTAFGHYVAFTSAASNMVAGQSDSNNAADVFLYEVATGTLKLVSHIAGNLATSGAGGATLVAIDGNHVIFNSSNPNHVVGGTDTNGVSDVFSYEIATGAITLISHAAGANLTAASGQSIAARGDWTSNVVFETTAGNLNPAFTGALTKDVVLWQRDSNTFRLISRASTGANARANAAAQVAASNLTNSRIVFETSATNVVANYFAALTNASNLYVFDFNSGSNQMITHLNGQPSTGSARAVEPTSVRLSWDGETVVLASPAGDLSPGSDGNAMQDIYAYNHPANSSTLISKSAFARASSADKVTTPIDISADGRYVLQTSSATNLGFDQIESNNDSDVFVFDADSGVQSLISFAIEGFEVLPNVPGNGASTAKAISRDGAYVLFSSAATNLVALQNDTNAAIDVFLKDRVSGGLSLVSHASNSTIVAASAVSTPVAVSANSQYVLYDSNANNLVASISDTNNQSDVFLYDRTTLASVLVSKTSGAATSANDRSQAIALSADGRYVLYQSRATNLIAGFVNLNGAADDVWLYDRTTATSRLISREVGSAVRGANAGANPFGFSDDGDRVLFVSPGGNMIAGGVSTGLNNVFVHQVSTTTTRLVSHGASAETDIPSGASTPIAISGDGSTVLFGSHATTLVNGFVDNNGPSATDVFLYNTATRVNTLFSRSHTGATQGSNREWRDPRLNADGSRIVFATLASDVINGVNSGAFSQQVYQYDRAGASISLVSHRDGAVLEANNSSSNPVISSGGDRVAFASSATNLAAWTDLNSAADAFLAQRVNGYVITPVINGNGSISPAGAQTVAIGGTMVFTLTPSVGQQIASASGCGGSLVGNQYTTAAAAADCTVTFNFAPQQFTLQYLAAANGSIGGTANQTVDYGGSGSEVQALPAVGYNFDRWSDNRPGAGRTDSNVTANLSVTAFFTIQRFNLLYSAGPGGTIDGQPSQLFSVDYGSDGPTVTAQPNAGQVFVSWSDGALTASRSDLDVTAHITVQAQFAANAQLTVTPIIGANGAATPNTPQSVAPGGTTFFDLVPNPGYRIGSVAGCNGALVGVRYTTGAVNQNCNVTMSFNRTPVVQNGTLDAIEDGGSYGGQINANDDDAYTISVVMPPAKGDLIMQASGQYFYAPNADANGSDSFTFKINDGVQDSNTATVSINIVAVNDKPAFALSPAIVPEHAAGTSGAQTRSGILSAIDFGPPDEDASQSVASVQAFEIFDPSNILSAVSISNVGVLTYTLSGAAGLAKVNVTLTDSGGTANGGAASSDPRELTISVRNASDLQISDSNGTSSVTPGQALVYEVLVANAGPYAVTGALLDIPLPAGLGNVLWSCNSIQLASCPQANGAGAINDLAVNLPSTAVLRFLVTGTVTASIGATLQHSATITLPAPMLEINAANNTAADIDPVAAAGVHIFGSGFETQNRITVPIPPDGLLYPVE